MEKRIMAGQCPPRPWDWSADRLESKIHHHKAMLRVRRMVPKHHELPMVGPQNVFRTTVASI